MMHLFYILVNCRTFRSSSNILSSALWMSWDISGNSSNVNSVAGITFSLGHRHPFCHNTLLVYVDEFAFTKFLWLYMYSLSNSGVSAFSQSALSSLAPYTLYKHLLMYQKLLRTCYIPDIGVHMGHTAL